jgi:hypothetical protein
MREALSLAGFDSTLPARYQVVADIFEDVFLDVFAVGMAVAVR